jgi:S-adenosyl methyltransferase
MSDGITGLDFSRPNVARVYDTLLGGSSGFAADRAQARRLREICPQLRDAARENHAFLARTVA